MLLPRGAFLPIILFLNAALCVGTALAPLEVLQTTQEIEREMGRTHKSVNAVYSDRVIDIDLLLCFADDGTPVLLDTPELKLPHPLMQERRFVMEPLAEIASGVVHPVLGKTIGGIVAKSVLISAICSADTRFLFYLCLRKAKIGCTSA